MVVTPGSDHLELYLRKFLGGNLDDYDAILGAEYDEAQAETEKTKWSRAVTTTCRHTGSRPVNSENVCLHVEKCGQWHVKDGWLLCPKCLEAAKEEFQDLNRDYFATLPKGKKPPFETGKFRDKRGQGLLVNNVGWFLADRVANSAHMKTSCGPRMESLVNRNRHKLFRMLWGVHQEAKINKKKPDAHTNKDRAQIGMTIPKDCVGEGGTCTPFDLPSPEQFQKVTTETSATFIRALDGHGPNIGLDYPSAYILAPETYVCSSPVVCHQGDTKYLSSYLANGIHLGERGANMHNARAPDDVALIGMNISTQGDAIQVDDGQDGGGSTAAPGQNKVWGGTRDLVIGMNPEMLWKHYWEYLYVMNSGTIICTRRIMPWAPNPDGSVDYIWDWIQHWVRDPKTNKIESKEFLWWSKAAHDPPASFIPTNNPTLSKASREDRKMHLVTAHDMCMRLTHETDLAGPQSSSNMPGLLCPNCKKKFVYYGQFKCTMCPTMLFYRDKTDDDNIVCPVAKKRLNVFKEWFAQSFMVGAHGQKFALGAKAAPWPLSGGGSTAGSGPNILAVTTEELAIFASGGSYGNRQHAKAWKRILNPMLRRFGFRKVSLCARFRNSGGMYQEVDFTVKDPRDGKRNAKHLDTDILQNNGILPWYSFARPHNLYWLLGRPAPISQGTDHELHQAESIWNIFLPPESDLEVKWGEDPQKVMINAYTAQAAYNILQKAFPDGREWFPAEHFPNTTFPAHVERGMDEWDYLASSEALLDAFYQGEDMERLINIEWDTFRFRPEIGYRDGDEVRCHPDIIVKIKQIVQSPNSREIRIQNATPAVLEIRRQLNQGRDGIEAHRTAAAPSGGSTATAAVAESTQSSTPAAPGLPAQWTSFRVSFLAKAKGKKGSRKGTPKGSGRGSPAGSRKGSQKGSRKGSPTGSTTSSPRAAVDQPPAGRGRGAKGSGKRSRSRTPTPPAPTAPPNTWELWMDRRDAASSSASTSGSWQATPGPPQDDRPRRGRLEWTEQEWSSWYSETLNLQHADYHYHQNIPRQERENKGKGRGPWLSGGYAAIQPPQPQHGGKGTYSRSSSQYSERWRRSRSQKGNRKGKNK